MYGRGFHRTILLLAVVSCAAAARAEEVVYGPDGAPTVVQRKLYTMTGKWEVAAFFGIAMNTALVNQMGGLVAVTYHPNEWFDGGLEGLFNSTALSTLGVNVRRSLPARVAGNQRDEFANDNQLRAGGFAVARVTPIYGKLNLAGELSLHFQAYLLGGGGVIRVHRESVNLCADAGTADCESFQQSDATKGAGEVGAGFRFYLGQRWSLRTEVRGYFFPSSYKKGNDPTLPATGTPHTYLAAIATFDAGVAWLF